MELAPPILPSPENVTTIACDRRPESAIGARRRVLSGIGYPFFVDV